MQIANGIVLSDRKTPFTAVDLTLVKSVLPILSSYLEVWQIVADCYFAGDWSRRPCVSLPLFIGG